ncbi:MAG: 2-iminoacetate synthase ThiH [Rikenellaceae bacterium]
MFSDEIAKISWEATTEAIYSRTAADVERVLAKVGTLSVDDFMTLISPAASPYIEEMARRSRQYTLERFGKTISMFIPLYLTNSCRNGCVYCGFQANNKLPRTILTIEQIEDEYKAIKRLAPFDNILLVTGENPAKAGVDYLAEAIELAKKYFANIQIEVMPLEAEEYYKLTTHGLNGVICFQESYNRANYKKYHPIGRKSDYEWRVNGFDRMGKAGVHKIGMGILIGLEEWRTDATMMAHHLRYLQRNYWRTKYSINYPRMRPSENEGFKPNVIINDRDYAQLIFATRLFDHDVDISLSTREPAALRDNLSTLGVTTMSADSRTEPGGYYSYPQALEQFHISDDRSAIEVAKRLSSLDREAVWKDWDRSYDNR